jgi:hypothetical protein
MKSLEGCNRRKLAADSDSIGGMQREEMGCLEGVCLAVLASAAVSGSPHCPPSAFPPSFPSRSSLCCPSLFSSPSSTAPAATASTQAPCKSHCGFRLSLLSGVIGAMATVAELKTARTSWSIPALSAQRSQWYYLSPSPLPSLLRLPLMIII